MKNAVALNDKELESVAGGFGLGDFNDYLDVVISIGPTVVKKVKEVYNDVTRKPKIAPEHPIIMNGNKK